MYNLDYGLLKSDISVLALCPRSEQIFRRAGIDTIEQLARLTEGEASKLKGAGRKTINEVKEALADHHLCLNLGMWLDRENRMSVPEPLDCRSPEGIAVGMIDSIIFSARVLTRHYGLVLRTPEVQKALLDLREDEDLRELLQLISKAAPKGGMSGEEKEMVNRGQLVPAVKSIRAREQCSLREAKDILDAYRRERRMIP